MKEIIIVMGFPCSGKSTLVKKYVDQDYIRLNRDDEGSSIDQLHQKLDKTLSEHNDCKGYVLDNTYGTKQHRESLLNVAKKHNCKTKCVWLKTSIEDAQFNSAWRILDLDGAEKFSPDEILGPEGSSLLPSSDNVPAIALFAYKKRFEKPSKDEGWDEIKNESFKRNMSYEYVNKAIVLDYDGTLRETKSGSKYPSDPSDINVFVEHATVLKQYQREGYLLLGVSNQSGVEKGDVSKEKVEECFRETNRQLGLYIDYVYCPHHSFPIRCYCRKPMPGLPVYLIKKYKLDPSKCIFVGDMTTDKTCAARSGMQFQWAKDFFKV